MKKIEVCNDLHKIIPSFKIGVILFDADILINNNLTYLINDMEQLIKQKYTLSDVLEITNIKDARNGYKKLGKDPSRYRLAVESLYRRIVKGNSLYRINNIVDIGNVLSLKTSKSIAVLDYEKINGNILIRIGKDEIYEGIGRGNLNILNIPIYCDDLGPFGSPTSDTERTMITESTKKVLVFIISFNGQKELDDDIKLCIDLYKEYAKGVNFQYMII